MTKRVAVVAVAVLAFAGGLWMLRSRARSPAAGPPAVRDNILLITLDTARADRFGAYGYARARTRYLDRLAAEGVRFEWAFSTAPITLPAHASIFSGLYPFEHGVRNNGNFYLSDKVETLATTLAKHGYRTGAFVSAFVLDRRYGLARGFDVYDDRMRGAQAQVVSLEAERRGDYTSQALTAWLDRESGDRRPFFAWLHLYDPHEPYRAPQPFRDAFADSPTTARLPSPTPSSPPCWTSCDRSARPRKRSSRWLAITARASAIMAKRRIRCSSTMPRFACHFCCGGRDAFQPGPSSANRCASPISRRRCSTWSGRRRCLLRTRARC